MVKSIRLKAVILVSIVFSLLVPAIGSCIAQELGEIRGRIADPKGVPVPAAVVRLFSGAPGPPMETLTGEDGTFSFANLPSGAYRITVEMTGFTSATKEGVDPASPSARQLQLTLLNPPRPAAPQQAAPPARNGPASRMPQGGFREVEMTGDVTDASPLPPASQGSTPAQTDNSDVLVISGGTSANFGAIDWNDAGMRDRITDMVQRMGFGGFAISDFPERQGAGSAGAQGEGGFGGGGGRPGGPAGGGMGGGPMGGGPPGGPGMVFGGGRGMMTRQPKVSGSLFVNYRNSAVNAHPYSLSGKTLDAPLQIQNNFGASIGGALPWKPKAAQSIARAGRRMPGQSGMWFFNYEGGRNRSPFDVLATVPTSLERAGDFSQTALRSGQFAGKQVQLYDPASPSVLFAGGRIPESRMNPAATALMQFFPLPNLPGSVQNFTMQRGLMSTSDSYSFRVNSPITSKLNGGVNYSMRRADNVSSQTFPGLDTTRETRGHNLGLTGMYRYRPRLVINFRATWNRNSVLSSNPFSFANDVAGELGITGVSLDPINYGPPTLSFTNYGDLQVANPSLNRTQGITLGAGVNRMGSKHTVTGGGDITLNQRNSFGDQNARGTFDFTGLATSRFDSQGRAIAGTGYDFADFLLGYAASTSRRYGSSSNYLRNRTFNLFVQDNWRVRANITISAGLRYEFIQPFYEKYGRIVTLDLSPGFTSAAPAFPLDFGGYGTRYPKSLVYADRNNLGPRLGIAWKKKPNSRWLIRAGWGLFYNPGVYSYVVGQLVGQPPFAVNQNILTSSEYPLTLQSGFPTLPDVTVLNSYAIDPHYRLGYIQQWNLSYQAQFLRLYTLEAGYNGSKGTRLDVLRAPNRAPSGSSASDVEENRPISNAGNFVYQESSANSILHSLRVNATRRFSRGVRMDSSYTFSKSIDNASGVGGGSLVVVQDEKNLLAERSLSSFDQRHKFQLDFTTDVPFGRQRRFFSSAPSTVQGIISGWSLNGTLQMNSGTPLTARQSSSEASR
jgi:trimeric autotransporter adhesin